MVDPVLPTSRRFRRAMAVAGAFALVAILVGPLLAEDVLGLGVWWGHEAAPGDLVVFLQYRLPRTALAALAGATLALAGAVFQALLRNPLATPYTLGVASGASFGASLAIVLGLTAWLPHGLGLPVFALLGTSLSVLLVLAFAGARVGLPGDTLILAGVTLNFFLGSLVMFLHCLAHPMELVRMVRWNLGGLETGGYLPVVRVLPFALAAFLIALSRAADLNQFGGGEELAHSRGVDVARTRRLLFLVTSLATGVLVAETGPIGFVGLIVPHTVRRLAGTDHRILLPVAALGGAGFLVLCDAAARVLSAGVDLPVGVLTALLGGPFFLFVLCRSRGRPGRG